MPDRSMHFKGGSVQGDAAKRGAVISPVASLGLYRPATPWL
jgi:hypothetical protein